MSGDIVYLKWNHTICGLNFDNFLLTFFNLNTDPSTGLTRIQ